MSEASEKIPFDVDISRMIEVLAAQIYPTPFALLRENVQNSFDAILLRQHLGQQFDARIDVTIEPQRVCVTDNGIGMSREELANTFEPFYRAETSRGDSKGHGLGLAIVRRLSDRYGWTLNARSQPGQGTTVELRFRGA